MTEAIGADSKDPIDGDVAVLLGALRNHTYQSEEELRDRIDRHSGDEKVFPKLWRYVKSSKLVASTKLGVRLSPDGEEWLDERGYELQVEEEDIGSDGKPTKPYAVAKLKMETKHLSVFQALRKIEKKEINLNPDFQRAFVWDEVKQSRLIESVLIRIPLPAFYLDATDQIHWSVVDGLQRLTTLFKYCRGRSFPLQGLQFLRELEGDRFDELPPKYRVLIEDDTQLLFYNLMPGTPVEAKYTIFSRVNTGGLQLTPQEIRHALNQGQITQLLARLAADSTFRSVTQGVVESLRMSDRELVLRALAFMHMGVEAYREYNELDAFLLASMSSLNKVPSSTLGTLSEAFIAALEKVHKIFGKYAFRKFTERGGRRSPFNKALFETWIYAVQDHDIADLRKHRETIMDEFAELVSSDISFARSISSSTGSFSAVNTRFTRIEKLLTEALR